MMGTVERGLALPSVGGEFSSTPLGRGADQSPREVLQFFWNLLGWQNEINAAGSLRSERHDLYFGRRVLSESRPSICFDLPAALSPVAIIPREFPLPGAEATELLVTETERLGMPARPAYLSPNTSASASSQSANRLLSGLPLHSQIE